MTTDIVNEEMLEPFNILVSNRKEVAHKEMTRSAWHSYLSTVKSTQRIQVLHEGLKSDLSTEDKAYLIHETWVMEDYLSQNLHWWLAVIQKFGFHMTDEEQSAFDVLPEQVTIYRGYCADSGTEDGVSWTLDRRTAEFFAETYARTGKRSAPSIAKMIVNKADLTALCNDRGESEVIYTAWEEG
jgi:hypothetical protein